MSLVIPGKLIYLANARTASNATEQALSKYPCYVTRQHHQYLHNIRNREGNELITTTVRNPFDVIATWWVLNCQEWPNIETFISEWLQNHLLIKKRKALFKENTDCSSFIMRYENLQADLDKVLTKVDLEPVQLERVNVTKDKLHYSNYYTKRSIGLVKRMFKMELEMFDYDFEEYN